MIKFNIATHLLCSRKNYVDIKKWPITCSTVIIRILQMSNSLVLKWRWLLIALTAKWCPFGRWSRNCTFFWRTIIRYMNTEQTTVFYGVTSFCCNIPFTFQFYFYRGLENSDMESLHLQSHGNLSHQYWQKRGLHSLSKYHSVSFISKKLGFTYTTCLTQSISWLPGKSPEEYLTLTDGFLKWT